MYSSAQLVGGLGNQMFQIGHAYTQALRAQLKGYNVTARFDSHAGHLEEFPERQVTSYRDNILQRVDFTPLTAEEAAPHNWEHLQAHSFHYEEVVPEWGKSVKFHGYFQSEKYFNEYTQRVIDLFAPPEDIKADLLEETPQIMNNTTAIFVRRGDYFNHPETHPIITEDYLSRAIEVNTVTNPGHYLIVSDDYAWCDAVLPKYISKDRTTNASGPDWKQLWAASLCANFICSNSTFGWWSAFLAKSETKQVIFPAKWFGPTGPKNWQDIYINKGIILW